MLLCLHFMFFWTTKLPEELAIVANAVDDEIGGGAYSWEFSQVRVDNQPVRPKYTNIRGQYTYQVWLRRTHEVRQNTKSYAPLSCSQLGENVRNSDVGDNGLIDFI